VTVNHLHPSLTITSRAGIYQSGALYGKFLDKSEDAGGDKRTSLMRFAVKKSFLVSVPGEKKKVKTEIKFD
jgi:hypothetical protein